MTKIKRLNWAAAALVAVSALSLQAQTSYKFDFGPGPVKPGYTQVLSTTTYTAARGYGFDFNVPVTCVDRGGTDSLTGDGCNRFGYFYFSMNLVEGNYTVTVTLGDKTAASATTIKAETRRLFVEKLILPAGSFSTQTFTVNRRNAAISGGSTSVGVSSRELGGLNWDGNKLTLEFNGHAAITSLVVEPAVNPRQIFLAGNSTQCDWATETETAWGQMVTRFFKSTAVVVGMAESGLTTASFIAQRRLDKIMSMIHAGDYLFVEFGHNDMKSMTIAEFKTNLTTFATKAKSVNAIPIFVTPTARHSFTGTKADQTFTDATGDWVGAMKDAATANSVQVIDLNAMVMKFIETLGPTNSAKAYWYHENTQDHTHFSDYGAYEVARMVVEGIRTGIPALLPFLSDDVKPFDPANPDPITWTIPLSADTSVWHYHGGVEVQDNVVIQKARENISLAAFSATSRVTFEAGQSGQALFTLFSVNGKELAKKNVFAKEATGSFVWEQMGKLPQGVYFLTLAMQGQTLEKIKFVKF